MKFFKLFKKFEEAEDGAVTVDWVVLTAAVVGLGVAALAATSSPQVAGPIGLRLSGRFSVRRAIGPESSTRIVAC